MLHILLGLEGSRCFNRVSIKSLNVNGFNMFVSTLKKILAVLISSRNYLKLNLALCTVENPKITFDAKQKPIHILSAAVKQICSVCISILNFLSFNFLSSCCQQGICYINGKMCHFTLCWKKVNDALKVNYKCKWKNYSGSC